MSSSEMMNLSSLNKATQPMRKYGKRKFEEDFKRLRFVFPQMPGLVVFDLLAACGDIITAIDSVMHDHQMRKKVTSRSSPRQMHLPSLTDPTPCANPTCPYRFIPYVNQFHPNDLANGQGQNVPPSQPGPQMFATVGHMARSHTDIIDVIDREEQNNNINFLWQQPNFQDATEHISGGMSGGAVLIQPAPRKAARYSSGEGLPGSVGEMPLGMMSQGGHPGGFGPSEVEPLMYPGDIQYRFAPALGPGIVQGGLPDGYSPSVFAQPRWMDQEVLPEIHGTYGLMPSGYPQMGYAPNVMAGGMQSPGTQPVPLGMMFSDQPRSVDGMIPVNTDVSSAGAVDTKHTPQEGAQVAATTTRQERDPEMFSANLQNKPLKKQLLLRHLMQQRLLNKKQEQQ